LRGSDGRVQSLSTVRVRPIPDENGRVRFEEQRGSEHEWPADLVLLAIGYLGPEREGLIEKLGIELDARGDVKTDENGMTTGPGYFAAGDTQGGQSLLVWATSACRETARGLDAYLRRSEPVLPTKGEGDLLRLR